ncbi:hypothetical protein TNCV_4051131, partial [Trichonephila clavipes]
MSRLERLFPEGWEKKINHDVKVEQIKKTPTKTGRGRTYPIARNALMKQSVGGGSGKNMQEGRRDGRRL